MKTRRKKWLALCGISLVLWITVGYELLHILADIWLSWSLLMGFLTSAFAYIIVVAKWGK